MANFRSSRTGQEIENAVNLIHTLLTGSVSGLMKIVRSGSSVTIQQQNIDSTATESSTNPITSGAVYTGLAAKANTTALTSHTSNTSNPHSVTKAQVGLSNVDNTSDANKPISTATQTALNAKANTTALTAETTRATAAEQANATAISSETTRATTAETNLSSQISDLRSLRFYLDADGYVCQNEEETNE